MNCLKNNQRNGTKKKTQKIKNLLKLDFESIRQEIIELEKYRDLAESIKHNTKGDKLLTALKEGFAKMDKQANQKAIIFTESTRTQNYLFNLLSEHYPDKIVLFNGSNTMTKHLTRFIKIGLAKIKERTK
jgi:ERCC4-related helicase